MPIIVNSLDAVRKEVIANMEVEITNGITDSLALKKQISDQRIKTLDALSMIISSLSAAEFSDAVRQEAIANYNESYRTQSNLETAYASILKERPKFDEAKQKVKSIETAAIKDAKKTAVAVFPELREVANGQILEFEESGDESYSDTFAIPDAYLSGDTETESSLKAEIDDLARKILSFNPGDGNILDTQKSIQAVKDELTENKTNDESMAETYLKRLVKANETYQKAAETSKNIATQKVAIINRLLEKDKKGKKGKKGKTQKRAKILSEAQESAQQQLQATNERIEEKKAQDEQQRTKIKQLFTNIGNDLKKNNKLIESIKKLMKQTSEIEQQIAEQQSKKELIESNTENKEQLRKEYAVIESNIEALNTSNNEQISRVDADVSTIGDSATALKKEFLLVSKGIMSEQDELTINEIMKEFYKSKQAAEKATAEAREVAEARMQERLKQRSKIRMTKRVLPLSTAPATATAVPPAPPAAPSPTATEVLAALPTAPATAPSPTATADVAEDDSQLLSEVLSAQDGPNHQKAIEATIAERVAEEVETGNPLPPVTKDSTGILSSLKPLDPIGGGKEGIINNNKQVIEQSKELTLDNMQQSHSVLTEEPEQSTSVIINNINDGKFAGKTPIEINTDAAIPDYLKIGLQTINNEIEDISRFPGTDTQEIKKKEKKKFIEILWARLSDQMNSSISYTDNAEFDFISKLTSAQQFKDKFKALASKGKMNMDDSDPNVLATNWLNYTYYMSFAKNLSNYDILGEIKLLLGNIENSVIYNIFEIYNRVHNLIINSQSRVSWTPGRWISFGSFDTNKQSVLPLFMGRDGKLPETIDISVIQEFKKAVIEKSRELNIIIQINRYDDFSVNDLNIIKYNCLIRGLKWDFSSDILKTIIHKSGRKRNHGEQQIFEKFTKKLNAFQKIIYMENRISDILLSNIMYITNVRLSAIRLQKITKALKDFDNDLDDVEELTKMDELIPVIILDEDLNESEEYVPTRSLISSYFEIKDSVGDYKPTNYKFKLNKNDVIDRVLAIKILNKMTQNKLIEGSNITDNFPTKCYTDPNPAGGLRNELYYDVTVQTFKSNLNTINELYQFFLNKLTSRASNRSGKMSALPPAAPSGDAQQPAEPDFLIKNIDKINYLYITKTMRDHSITDCFKHQIQSGMKCI